MALEEAAAGVLVHLVRVPVVDARDALAQLAVRPAVAALLEDGRHALVLEREGLRVRDGLPEEQRVGVEAELVHRVDRREVVEHEVEQRGARGHRPVALARGVDLDLGHLGDLQRARHLLARRLGVVERGHEVRVVEQRALDLAEQPQDHGLEVRELALAARNGLHELALLLLHLGLLHAHDDGQQLALEALLLHGEVDDGRLGRHLGRVVRVRQLGRDVEPELAVVVELLVAELEHLARALLDDAAREHGLERGVELLLDVLQQVGQAVGDGRLELAQEVLALEVLDLERALLLHLLDPLVRLALRVDHERPAAAARDDDAVLGAEVVRGQPLDVPVAHVRGVREEVREVEVVRHGHAVVLDGAHPARDEAVAVGRVEGPGVAREGGRDERVARHVAEALLVARDARLPAHALAGEAADEALGAAELVEQRRGLHLQRRLLRH